MSELQKLEIGYQAPGFSILDQDGKTVSLSDYSGKKVIVYFYPAASTPGCTKEACDFNENLNSLKSAGYHVLGVSPDPIAKLAKFRDAQDLNFPLLSDLELEVHKSYGAYGTKSMYGREYQGVLRSTFVVDGAGKLELALYNVKATGHVTMLRAKLGI